VLEAFAKQDATILWDSEARQKVFFDEATVRTPLEAEVVVYAHWQTSQETAPARVQRSVELPEEANGKSADAGDETGAGDVDASSKLPEEANGKAADAGDETGAGDADASSKMYPCFMMSTFTLKVDFSLRKGLCGEFSLDSVVFE